MTHLHFFENLGWREGQAKSLEEVHRSVPIPETLSFTRKMLAFAGPGFLIAVGYMDPGNWATDLAAGSKFGYTLLFVVLISNLFAILLQHLALKLGIATGRDLAQMCRENFPRPVSFALWLLAEGMIIACDLAEVIGSAIGLNLLFGIPLIFGIVITAADVLVLLALQSRGFRYLEAVIITLIGTIMTCFGIEIALAQPAIAQLVVGFIPTGALFSNTDMLYIAIGILGATVMPHNLYLHSAIVQTRQYSEDERGKREAIFFSTIDSTVALSLAFFVNAAILVVSSAVFFSGGLTEIAEIQEAHRLLAPLLGTTLASVAFALALLASGQNSTITGTLAGQIIMEGFLRIRLAPWARRMVTRLLAIIPAIVVVVLYGEHELSKLLVLSQVILSLQLPFAVFPLVYFTSSRSRMGVFANSVYLSFVAYTIALVIAFFNGWLLYLIFWGT